MKPARLARAAAGAVIRQPALWPTAIRLMVRTARRGWWHRPPFLPLPSASYAQFRLLTQYGDAEATPTADDIISYLRWCRDWPAH